MYLKNAIIDITSDKREKLLYKIQCRVDNMNEAWWEQKVQEIVAKSEHCKHKPDEQIRINVMVLEFERYEKIYQGYCEILKKAKNNVDMDVQKALEHLKTEIAVYDENIAYGKSKFLHYEKMLK